MAPLLKLGVYRNTKEKAVDTLLDINAEDKGLLSASPKARKKRKKLNTLAVGLAGVASTFVPGIPLQGLAAKALAPKEKSTGAAIDSTTYSTVGSSAGLGYLGHSIIKEKGGVKPAVKSIEKLLKPKSDPKKARSIPIAPRRFSKKLPRIDGTGLENKTKIPVEKIQRILKSISIRKSKMKGAGAIAALGGGLGAAYGYNKSTNKEE